MPKPTFRQLSVYDSVNITPNMQRIVLTGDALSDFPDNQESGYIKLMFDAVGNPLIQAPAVVNGKVEKPSMRSYTIRHYDAVEKRLTVDFVLHGHGDDQGPAARWAETAKIGDCILISGPGPKKLVDNSADWFLLVGDMTALPAISCNLEQLPSHATGYAVIEIADAQDRQCLQTPKGVELLWVVNENLNPDTSALVDTVKKLEWLSGKPAVWAACEFNTMRQLRKYFKTERGVQRDELYISSYWKKGLADEQHKIAKRKDAEECNTL